MDNQTLRDLLFLLGTVSLAAGCPSDDPEVAEDDGDDTDDDTGSTTNTSLPPTTTTASTTTASTTDPATTEPATTEPATTDATTGTTGSTGEPGSTEDTGSTGGSGSSEGSSGNTTGGEGFAECTAVAETIFDCDLLPYTQEELEDGCNASAAYFYEYSEECGEAYIALADCLSGLECKEFMPGVCPAEGMAFQAACPED